MWGCLSEWPAGVWEHKHKKEKKEKNDRGDVSLSMNNISALPQTQAHWNYF